MCRKPQSNNASTHEREPVTRRIPGLVSMMRESIAGIDTKFESCISTQRPTDVDPETSTKGVKHFAIEVLSILPGRERNIIAARYGLWNGVSHSLQDIGGKLGLTRERIRQIERDALERLRTYAHCVIQAYTYERARECIENDPQKQGVISEEEAVAALAVRCTVEEVALALDFLKDLVFQNENVLAGGLIEAEPHVYSLRERAKIEYLRTLRLVESVVRSHGHAISESSVLAEISSNSDTVLHQIHLARRVISVSPRFSRLRDGTIACSEWSQLERRSATTMSAAALRLLGRPAHFREITAKANAIVDKPLKELTIHGAIISHPKVFVRVKDGTYGLAAWGLKKPPFVKDRLIQLLSSAGHPLPLRYLERKVLDVCNCKPDTVRMQLHFNPQIFVKLPDRHYGLRTLLQSD